jgi:hypothetical protein
MQQQRSPYASQPPQRRGPYRTPGPGVPQRQGKTMGLLIGIGIGVVLVGVVGVAALVVFGLGIFKNEVRDVLQANPVIESHIGTIQEISLDLVGTGEVEDPDTFVFNVVGSKGSGVITAKCITVGDAEEITEGSLTLTSGETFDLFPD